MVKFGICTQGWELSPSIPCLCSLLPNSKIFIYTTGFLYEGGVVRRKKPILFSHQVSGHHRVVMVPRTIFTFNSRGGT